MYNFKTHACLWLGKSNDFSILFLAFTWLQAYPWTNMNTTVTWFLVANLKSLDYVWFLICGRCLHFLGSHNRGYIWSKSMLQSSDHIRHLALSKSVKAIVVRALFSCLSNGWFQEHIEDLLVWAIYHIHSSSQCMFSPQVMQQQTTTGFFVILYFYWIFWQKYFSHFFSLQFVCVCFEWTSLLTLLYKLPQYNNENEIMWTNILSLYKKLTMY